MTEIGKRKATGRAPAKKSAKKAAKPAASAQELEDAQAIFRRHFEAQFAPLPEKQRKSSTDENEEDEDDASVDDDNEWDGVSVEEDEDEEDDSEEEDDSDEVEVAPRAKTASRTKSRKPDVVEVVDHSSKISTDTSKMTKQELKAYMSSKPPKHSDETTSTANTTKSSSNSKNSDLPEDAPTLLAQDLELRRLLQESHLLKPNTATSAKAAPKLFDSGRNRLKALDLRFQALGAKDSIFKDSEYKSMLNARRYTANKEAKETKRRKEARENGVILEREKVAEGKKGKKRKNGDRDMGVDRPGVGRMKGAQLTISDKDVRSIEGSRDVFGRGGKRRR